METQALPDLRHCVKALSGAFVLSARALQTEVAVSLLVFHEMGGASLDAKKALRQVYADAGRRDCLTHESPAYQTVMRRIGRCAALFDTFGLRRIKKAIGEATGAAAIAALQELIAPLEIETMDDVAAHAGQGRKAPPPAPAAPAELKRRAVDAPEVVHVKTRHIDVAVPPGTPAKELTVLANKLLALAGKMEA